MITVSAPAHTTSKIPSRESNNNNRWYVSANISSDSDSDWEEGYARLYSVPTLVHRSMLWKVASDGAINTVGRVYEDKDTAMCQCTEKQSEEDLSDLSYDDESAAYVDFIDDVAAQQEIVARQ